MRSVQPDDVCRVLAVLLGTFWLSRLNVEYWHVRDNHNAISFEVRGADRADVSRCSGR